MGDTSDTTECIACGAAIPAEEDGVFLAGGVKEDTLDELNAGEPAPLDDVISFDDGPYCSIDCSMDEGGPDG